MLRIRCRREAGARGYSIAEIALVLAVIGIVSALAIPMFVSYSHASRLRAAAEEVAAYLNQGRQIGIRENVGVCVHIAPTSMHYTLGTCAGTTWVGGGTDADGNIKLPDGVTVTTTADPVFSYLGAAAPAATYTITETQTSQTLRVFVAASGRVSIGP
jgi:Tfp pilus assembly protein FimT